MSDHTMIRFASTRDQSHAAAVAMHEHGSLLASLGKRVKYTVEEAQDEISILQRGFLHKAVLPQIAEQVNLPASMGGGRLDWRVWKEVFRSRFLGERYVLKATPKWDKKLGRLVIPKRKTPRVERISTEDLGIKAYSAYIDTVIDNAVDDYGVVFRFLAADRDAVRYKAPARKAKQAEREAETA